MKISLLSMTTFPTPPIGYGGEVCVYDLAMGLHKLGHEVVLYGVKNDGIEYPFKVNKLRYTYGNADYRAEHEAIEYYKDDIYNSDIIHDISHGKTIVKHIFNIDRENNALVTLLGHVWYGDSIKNVVVNSERQKQLGIIGADLFGNIGGFDKIKPTSKVVPLGTDTDFYKPKYDKQDYFLWFNRFHPWKGIKEVIYLAKKMGFNLIISGSAELDDHKHYRDQYLNEIRNISNIQYIEMPVNSDHQKIKLQLMQNAKAVINTIQYEECFGLTNIEALSCGTPLIANAKGALPEIIKPGENGFLCNSMEQMENYIKVIDEIDPRKCREDAEKRFSREAVAKSYEKIYNSVLDGDIF